MKKSKKYKKKKSRKEKDLLKSNVIIDNSIPVTVEDEEMLIIEDVDMPMDISTEVTVDELEDDDEEEITATEVSPVPKQIINTSTGISLIPEGIQNNLDQSSNWKNIQKSKFDKKSGTGISKKSRRKDGSKGDDDTDSEEERWLEAIESGKLEEVDDELKRMKNPRLMTARQRALMEKQRSDGSDEGFLTIPAEPLLALPSGFKEKVLTEEMLAKKAIKSQRRKEQALEKREDDKKKTVDRLLKKQDSKSSSKLSRTKSSKNNIPILTYINNVEGQSLSLPIGMDFPMEPQIESCPPKPKICGVDGCFNLKKYSCSKTGIPLCSLGCYKKNLISNAMLGLGS